MSYFFLIIGLASVYSAGSAKFKTNLANSNALYYSVLNLINPFYSFYGFYKWSVNYYSYSGI